MVHGSGLGDAYHATIGRIKAQEGDRARLGMAALMWLSHSERPLNVDEICHALAVEIGSTKISTNNLPSIKTVLSCCEGLAAVDEGSLTVRLIHFTLNEYLSRHADLFDRPHSNIAETCLTYLNFQAIKDPPASRSPHPEGTPLLVYSSLYWGTHMQMELSDRSLYLALDLLDQCDSHISAKLLCLLTTERYSDFPKPFTALRCISYFGIDQVAIYLIKTNRWDVNQRDKTGATLLMWAAKYGRENVVKFLLQQKHIQLDMADTRCGRTALSWAAESGHEEVVRLFLGSLFVIPGSLCRRWGKTPQVMSLLFGRKYVNPDRSDDRGQTPLSWAAWSGHDGVVKLLLGRGEVRPDRPDNTGRTPLSWAAWSGHDRVVKLLLEREDVSPDRPDNNGRTPLSWATEKRNEVVVKLLLAREDVSPDRPDNSGQTPLLSAAGNGYEGVVKLLLAREDVNPDRPNNSGQTPLLCAAENEYEEVVKLLLAREDVSHNKPGNLNQTLLSSAIRTGREGVVKLLLAREDVSLHMADGGGLTPLELATIYGRTGIMKLLKAQDAAGPSMA